MEMFVENFPKNHLTANGDLCFNDLTNNGPPAKKDRPE